MAPKARRAPPKKKLQKSDLAASAVHVIDSSSSEESVEDVGSSDFDSDSDDSSPQPRPSTSVAR